MNNTGNEARSKTIIVKIKKEAAIKVLIINLWFSCFSIFPTICICSLVVKVAKTANKEQTNRLYNAPMYVYGCTGSKAVP